MLETGVSTFKHSTKLLTQAIGTIVRYFIITFLFTFIGVFAWQNKSMKMYNYYKSIEYSIRSTFYSAAKEYEIKSLAKMFDKVTYRGDRMNLSDLKIRADVDASYQTLMHSMFVSLISALLLALLVDGIAIYYFIRRGRAVKAEKILRGPQMTEVKDFNYAIKHQKLNSDFKLGGAYLSKKFETGHSLFEATTGAGKTVAMTELFDETVRKKQPGIIYDPEGYYTSIYYREGYDTILNPLDIRSAFWSLWAEGNTSIDFDKMADVLIPLSPGTSSEQQFWVTAARNIFSVTANVLYKRGNPTINELVRACITSDMKEVEKLAKGTIAESLMSKDAAKLALSVKAVLTNYIKSLCYLQEPSSANPAFSITDWVNNVVNNNEDRRLFITSRHEHHAVLKPLISVWIDIATNAICALPEDLDRRFWLFIDELPTLQTMVHLPSKLALGRKHGLCAAVSVQGRSQLYTHYSKSVAREILDTLNTRFYGRAPNTESAKEISENLGEYESEQTQQGISYGSLDMRDSVSIHQQTSLKRLVLPSEITDLPDLTAIVHLPGQKLRTKIKLKPKARKKVAPAFVPSDNITRDTHTLVALDNKANPLDADTPKIRVSKRKNNLVKMSNQNFEIIADNTITSNKDNKSIPEKAVSEEQVVDEFSMEWR